MTLEPLDDLISRLERERLAADRIDNDALTALDRAVSTPSGLPAAPAAAERTRLGAVNDRSQILPGGSPVRRRSLKGRLAGFIWRLVGPPLQRQAEFNAAVTDHLQSDGRRTRTWSEAAGRSVRPFRPSSRRSAVPLVAPSVPADGHGIRGHEGPQHRRRRNSRSPGTPRAAGPGDQAGARTRVVVRRDRPDSRPSSPVRSTPRRTSASKIGFAAPHPKSRGGSRITSHSRARPRRRRHRLRPRRTARGASGPGHEARGVDSNAAMVEVCRSSNSKSEQGDASRIFERQAGWKRWRACRHPGGGTLRTGVSRPLPGDRISQNDAGRAAVLETINAACWMAFFETYIRGSHSPASAASGHAALPRRGERVLVGRRTVSGSRYRPAIGSERRTGVWRAAIGSRRRRGGRQRSRE